MAEITRADIAHVHEAMRSTPVAANRVLAVLHKAFNLAEVWGWRPPHTNPVHGIERYKEKKRRRYPIEGEPARLFDALTRFDHPVFTGFVWLLMFTGCRPSEILTARWEWIREDGLHLPDSKGGEDVVALSVAARAVLKKMPRMAGNPYIVPGRVTGGRLVGTGKLWAALLREAGIENLQMRDLRRYAASLGLSGGLTLEAVAQLLRHKQVQTSKTYAYLMTDAKQRAAETTASALLKARRRGRSLVPRISPGR